ncbi:hypothetical protein PENSPDRAFT_753666 [Peniophora sp. CONT]|nr:hypothetical protein PENSPDRAFT_753666 [Peniophora sp. CONT]
MDEGHTILHWKDFRPLMDHLKTITTRFPGVPVTIATASLTLADRTNLLNHLSIPPSSCRIISGSLDRPNLVYTVQPIHTFQNKRKLEAVYDFLKDQFRLRPESWRTQPKKAGIIYCATASHCDEVKKAINKAYGDDFAIAAYGERNGMDREAQRAAVKKWMDSGVQILVATIAFGMGIDKPDVAFVIHYDMPKTLENYIQETGRAGRNGERALCLLLLSWQDVQRTVFYAERTALDHGDPSLSTTGSAKAFAMAQYASTLTTCRHSQVLAHFGAALSSLQPCGNACDNCIKKEHLTTLVVSKTAHHIIDLFESEPIRAAGGAHGIETIINTLRGSAGKDVLPDKEKLGPVVGKARNVAYKTVEAVFGMLLAHGVLRGVPVAKVGSPHWGTNLRYSLGTRTLEAELYEDTERGRQIVLRTFAAASNDPMAALVDDDDDVHPTRQARTRGKRRARTPSSDEESHESDQEDDDDPDEHPGLSAKARGKLPERTSGSRSTGRSTLSSLTPITPGNSQSTSDSPRKRQRESDTISPRKRGRIDSDDEFVGASVTPSQSLPATRPRRQKQIPPRADAMRDLDDDEDEDRPRRISRQHRTRHTSGSPIEIFDSGEEEDRRRLSRRAPAPSDEAPRKKPSKPSQKTRQVAAKKTKVASTSATTARVADVDLIPDVEPPPELAAAFGVLWGARRTALERYGSREGPIGERDVLSDRALLALVVHQPLGELCDFHSRVGDMFRKRPWYKMDVVRLVLPYGFEK